MADAVHLGFEVGTGEPVEIPVAHMVVCGVTQAAGKTTTLEALASRMTDRAVLAFVTKRGEGSFRNSRRLLPYFRNRADWMFVDQLLEAQLREKNKFLRPWLMRTCRDTKTLADVHDKVKKALKKARGISEGVYTQLDAYLEMIVPEIGRARLAPAIDLSIGPNVMDLATYSTPMQMLFVQSAIDWVNEKMEKVVVVVPESWEFIPQGKGSPVKHSAEILVRKGAGLENFIWVDGQDLAGVDKLILRGCSVWLLGVQRETNEIKRNLANIPAGIKKPKPEDIAALGKGEFFACWKDRVVKTYVQPAWMDAASARGIAKGELSYTELEYPITPKEEDPVPQIPPGTPEAKITPPAAPIPVNPAAVAERLIQDLRRLLQGTPYAQPPGQITMPPDPSFNAPRAPEPAPAPGDFTVPGLSADSAEELYQKFKARLAAEAPHLLSLVTARPEIQVAVQRRVIEIDGDTLRGRIARLLAEGFFSESAKTTSAAFDELKKRGGNDAMPGVSNELVALSKLGFLTKDGKWWRAVEGMLVNVVEK